MAAPTPSTELAERTPQQELVSQVRSPEFREQIAAALPGNILPQRFQRAATTALMANPDLVKLDRNSLFVALLQSAQAGLLPDGKEAAIVAYKDRAQFLAMKDGYIKRAAEAGWQVSARVVYENDEFTYAEGLEPKLEHVPVRPGAERGERIAAYAIARHRDGRVAPPVVMYADEIAKRRAKAQTQTVWNEWTDRMFEKTCIKALVKELPTSDLAEWAVRVIAAEDMPPEQAAQLMYGDTPAGLGAGDGRTNGTDSSLDQQAEPSSTSLPEGGSAPDLDGEPDIGGEPEPEQEQPSPFQAPPDAQAARDAADAAGRYVVDRGRANIKGRTIAQIAAQPKGADWLKWVIAETKDHPAGVYARSYARVYLPEVYTEAMAILQAATQ